MWVVVDLFFNWRMEQYILLAESLVYSSRYIIYQKRTTIEVAIKKWVQYCRVGALVFL